MENKIGVESGITPIKAFRRNPIYKALAKVSGGNPFAACFIYFFASFGVLYIIGYLTGRLYGGGDLKAMYLYHVDNLSIGLLAPIGAGLITNLYNKIMQTTDALARKNIIRDEDMPAYNALLKEFDRIYNKRFVVLLSSISAAALSLYVFFFRKNSLLGMESGLTGVYGSLLVFINFAMILTVFYKCVVTIWMIQRVTEFDIKIKPMHPDHAGGLRDIGGLAMSVNYFLVLVMLYFTLIMVFDQFSQKFLAVYVIIYVFSFFMCFASLYGVHVKMKKFKEEVIERLENTSNFYYAKLQEKASVNGMFEMESADEIVLVDNLYNIVARMPVWPLDISHMIKFISTFIFPFIIFLSSLYANSKDLIDKVGGFNGILK